MGREFGGSFGSGDGGGSSSSFSHHHHHHRSNSDFESRYNNAVGIGTDTDTRASSEAATPRSTAWGFRVFCTLAACMVSVSIYMGYGTQKLELGVNDTRLLHPWPFFVSSMRVSGGSGDVTGAGPALYTFSRCPPTTSVAWQEEHTGVSVRRDSFESWAFWLNSGSRVRMRFNVSDDRYLTIIVLKGEGEVTFDATKKDDNYYFALGNLVSTDAVADVYFDVQAVEYDVSGSARKACRIGGASGKCQVDIPLVGRKCVVVAAPDSGHAGDVWNVSVRYRPRVFGYVLLLGLVVLVTFGITECYIQRKERELVRQGVVLSSTLTPAWQREKEKTSWSGEDAPLVHEERDGDLSKAAMWPTYDADLGHKDPIFLGNEKLRK
eukprot:jgi/Mesen1/626/ME000108S10785